MNSLFAPCFRGMRRNLRPGLVLQAFALLVLLAYFYWPTAHANLNRIGDLKAEYGYLYSAISTALFGGLVPYTVLFFTGRVPRGQRLAQALFYVLFWSWKGAEIDALYRAQALLFGNDASFTVIASKTAFDQMVYNSLWGAPTSALFFLWKDCGFSLKRTLATLRNESFFRRVLVVLFSTWVVWVPAVAIIYSLPAPLQIPLFSLVLCFWCLLLSFVSRDD